MHSPAGLRRLDHGRNVVGVPIDGHAPFDDVQGQTLGLEIAIVGTDQGGELRAGGMSHDQNVLRIASVLGDVVVDPVNGHGDVADDGRHVDARQESIVGGDEDESLVHENPRLDLNVRFVARLPAAAVNPKDHRQVFRLGRRIDIEDLARVGLLDVGDVALDVQRLTHELGNTIDGLPSFRKQRLVGLEDVEHAGPNFEFHRDSVRASLLGHAEAVVAEHLVLADLNQEWWKAAVVAEHRRGQRIARIGLTEIMVAEHGHGFRTDNGIDDRLERLAR